MNTELVPQGDPNPLDVVMALVYDSLRCDKTRQAYTYDIKQYLEWKKANHPDESICKAQVNRYLRSIENKFQRATINRKLAAIRKFVSAAAEAGFMGELAAAKVCSIQMRPVLGRVTGHWLSAEQCQRLIDSLDPDSPDPRVMRDRIAILLLLFSGIRHAELQNLKLGQIRELEGRRVLANIRGKGGRIRTVPLPQRIYADMDRWFALIGAYKNDEDPHETPFLRGFVTNQYLGPNGYLSKDPCAYEVISELVARAGAAIGVPELRPHDLRRTFIKLANDNGANLQQIQLAVGHTCLSTTQKYLQSLPALEAGRAACDFVEKAS